MRILFELYTSWFKIGLFTFGGGYAMLPMIEKEIIDKKHWSKYEDIMDYYAISQCTPGVIAVNTATFVGYKVKGIIGGVVATLGVVSPSLIIITLIATLLSNFAEIPVVIHALEGIKVGVCVLMVSSIYKLLKKSIVDKYAAIIFLFILGLALGNVVSTVYLVVIAGILGLLFSYLKTLKEKKNHE